MSNLSALKAKGGSWFSSKTSAFGVETEADVLPKKSSKCDHRIRALHIPDEPAVLTFYEHEDTDPKLECHCVKNVLLKVTNKNALDSDDVIYSGDKDHHDNLHHGQDKVSDHTHYYAEDDQELAKIVLSLVDNSRGRWNKLKEIVESS